MRGALIAIALAGLTTAAAGHMPELYSASCCHGTDKGGDCEPLPFEAVSETADGYRIDYTSPSMGEVHETVPYGSPNIYDSKNGFFHACLRAPGYPNADRIRCLYVPHSS